MQTKFKQELLVVVVSLLVAHAAPSLAAQCPPPNLKLPPMAVDLDLTVAQPVLHNDRSRSELTQLAGNDKLIGLKNSGLTRSRTEFRTEPRYRLAKFRDGKTCVVLESVKVKWRVEDVIVDVAREYAPGSCQYKAVLDHENEHVRITRETFAEFAPRIKERLERAAAEVRPQWGRDDARDVIDRLTKQISASGKAELAIAKVELARRQAAIDTRESYRDVAARCDKW
jgi:hypothetical protein